MARERIEERVMIPRYIKGHVFEECGRICAHCGKPMEFFGDFTLEHVIPLSKGGTNEKKNFVALCEQCNKNKSNDIIPPMEYFPYLPEKKRRQLQAMFDEYVTSQDWLDHDNLFMMDWFHIDPMRLVLMPKSMKPVYVPMTLDVKRIRDEDAFDRLQDYKKLLTKEDASLIVTSPDDIDTPYYIVEQNGKTILFFTMFIWQNTAPETTMGWEYVLMLDYYFTPGLKLNRWNAAPTLYNILQSLLHEANKTLLNGSNGTAIMVRLRSPKSSPYTVDLTNFIGAMVPGYAIAEQEFGNDRIPGNRIRLAEAIMFQGDKKDLRHIMKEYKADTLEQLSDSLDTSALQASIKSRLDASVRFGRKQED